MMQLTTSFSALQKRACSALRGKRLSCCPHLPRFDVRLPRELEAARNVHLRAATGRARGKERQSLRFFGGILDASRLGHTSCESIRLAVTSVRKLLSLWRIQCLSSIRKLKDQSFPIEA
eukprot:2935097-Pleurochrysis_carterae.AAC.3